MPSVSLTGFVPRELFGIDEIRMELLNALRAEGRAIRRDLKETVSTWSRKPGFQIKISLTRMAGFVKVWTVHEIYHWVNDGTPAHWIDPIYPLPPKRGLTIPTGGGGQPKTRPGRLKPGRGRRPKGPIVVRARTRGYRHPGTEARNFTGMIVEKIEKTNRFQNRLDTAITRGYAKSDKRTKIIK